MNLFVNVNKRFASMRFPHDVFLFWFCQFLCIFAVFSFLFFFASILEAGGKRFASMRFPHDVFLLWFGQFLCIFHVFSFLFFFASIFEAGGYFLERSRGGSGMHQSPPLSRFAPCRFETFAVHFGTLFGVTLEAFLGRFGMISHQSNHPAPVRGDIMLELDLDILGKP